MVANRAPALRSAALLVQLPLRERPIMSRVYLCFPWLLLSWQPWWLLVQVAQASDWVLDHVPLTSDPRGLTEPWLSHSSERSPELPPVLPPGAEPGGFDYLPAFSPDEMFAPPNPALAETLVPDPAWDSVGELPAGPDHFSVEPQDLNARLTPHPNLPEVPQVLGWGQNQDLVLPLLKSKTEGIDPDQAEDHQVFEILVPPLGSKSSKPTRLIVSPTNLKKDLFRHRQLAKVVVGNRGQSEKSQQLEELEDDYLDPSTNVFYPEDNLPTAFVESQAQPPEPTGEVESSAQKEAPAQHPQPTEEVESPLLEQEPLFQPSEAPEEVEEALAEASETMKEAGVQPSVHFRVNETQQSDLHNITGAPLDLALTMTPEVTKEFEPAPVQQEALSQPPVLESPSQPPERPEEVQLASPAHAPGFPTQDVLQKPASEEPEAPHHPPHPVHSLLPTVTLQPLDLGLTITPEPTKETESTPVQQEPLAQPVEPPEEVELSPTQQETSEKPPEPPEEVEPLSEPEQPAPPSELPGEDEHFPTQQQSPAQLSESLEQAETPPTEEETPALSAEEVEPSATLQEQAAQPPEPASGEAESPPPQQEQPAQPVEHHEVTVSPPSHHHAQHSNLPSVTANPVDPALVLTLEPIKEVETSPVQQEAPAQTLGPPGGVELPSVQEEAPAQSPVPLGEPAVSPEPPKEVEPSPTQQELQAQPSEPPEKAEPFLVPQGTLPEVLQSHEDVESPTQQETLEPLEETEPSPAQQEAQSQPPEPPKEVEAQTPVHSEMTVPTLGQDQAQPSVTVKPPEAIAADGSTLQQTTAPPTYLEATLPRPEQLQAQHPYLTEFTVQPLDLELTLRAEPTKEDEPSAAMQETPAQSLEPPKEVVAQPPLYQSVTNAAPGPDQAPYPTSSTIPVQPFDVVLTVTPEPTTEVEHSATPPPNPPEATLPRPEQVQAQDSTLTEVTVQPLDLELTIRAEPTKENEPSPPMQETLTQPPVSQSQTVLTPNQGQAEHPPSASVTVEPVHQEPTVTPEPTTEAEHSTGLQQAAAPPLEHPEAIPPRPDRTRVTVQPVDVELTLTPGSSVEAEPSPTGQEPPPQPPEPLPQEATVPNPSKDQGQGPTTTLRPPAEAGPSTVLQETTSPLPGYPAGTLPYPGLTRHTAPPVSITSQPGSTETILPSTQSSVVHSAKYAPEKEQSEQNAVDICELCTCRNETLSCTGLSPNQRLRSVPVLGPNSYNHTFTVL